MADNPQEGNLQQTQSYVESLKEALGIRTRLTEADRSSLNIARQTAKAIQDQKTGLSDLNTVQKQITKNEDLIHKNAKAVEGIYKNLNNEQKKSYKLSKSIQEELENLNTQRELALEKIEQGQQLEQGTLDSLDTQIAGAESALQKETEKIGVLGQQALYQEAIQRQLEASNKARKEEEQVLQKINQNMGILRKVTGGLSELPVIGSAFSQSLSIAEEEMKRITEETGKVPGKLQAAKIQLNALGDIIGKLALAALVKAALDLNKALVETQRVTGYTKAETTALNYEIQAASAAQGEFYTTSVDVLKTVTEITKQTGILGDVLGTEALVGASVLRDQMGLSAEAAGQFAASAAISGQEVQATASGVFDSVNAFNKQNKTALSAQQILEETAKVSKEIGATFGFNQAEIAKAATAAKALGMTLEDVKGVSKQLLDFESSIQNELQAELLTGKDLNLEKARQLALNNDLAGLAEELKKQNISALEFSKMNAFQQEATAKAMGMSTEQLAKTLYQQELNNLSAEEFKEKYGEQNYEASKQLDIQQRLQKALTKIADLVTPIIEAFANLASNAFVLYGTLATIAALKLGKVFGMLGGKGAAAAAEGGSKLGKTLGGLGKGLGSLGKSLANPYVIAGLAVFTGAVIGLGYALKLAAPGIEAIGNIIIGVLAAVPPIITAVAQGFVMLLGALSLEKAAAIIAVGSSLFLLAGGLGAFALAMAGAGIANFLAGDGVLGGLERLAAIAEPIVNIAGALGLLATNLQQFNTSLNNLDEDKLEALSDFGQETGPTIGSVVQGIAGKLLGTESSTSGEGNSGLKEEMVQIKNILTQILNKEGAVYIDSTKAGTSFAIGSAKL